MDRLRQELQLRLGYLLDRPNSLTRDEAAMEVPRVLEIFDGLTAENATLRAKLAEAPTLDEMIEALDEYLSAYRDNNQKDPWYRTGSPREEVEKCEALLVLMRRAARVVEGK